MIQVALKEWAVICQALLEGRQALLLRKGGIAELAGDFRLEATRFLFYPTFVHQQDTGIQPSAMELLAQVKAARAPAGRVRIEAWAEVTGIYQVRDPLIAQMLAHLHVWSDEAVAKRYQYRTPGINVLTVRTWRLPRGVEIEEKAAYLGCKSWVPLDEGLSTEGSTPILTDARQRDIVVQVDTLLRPTASA